MNDFNLKDYHKSKILGKGSYSVVFLYTRSSKSSKSSENSKLPRSLKSSKTESENKYNEVAVKRFITIGEGITIDTIREIYLIKKLNLLNLSYFLNILHIDYVNFDYMVMQKCDCDLRFFYTKIKMNNNQIKLLFKNICNALFILHSNGIIHRDLKTNNILMKYENNSWKIYLIDFGMSRIVSYRRDKRNMTPKIITLYYRPPEIAYNLQKEYSYEVDIWSLGCIFYELFEKKYLFNPDCEIGLLDSQFKLMGTPYDDPFYKDKVKIFPKYNSNFEEYMKNIDNEAKDLLKNMLNLNPFDRYTISNCLNHKYINAKYKFNHENFRMNNLQNYKYKFKYTDNRISETVTFKMRAILLEWLMELISYDKKSHETYFLTIYILDKYLINCKEKVNINNFQLIGMTSLYIASKINDVDTFEGYELIGYSDDSYKLCNLYEMEKEILKSLECNLDFISPTYIIDYYYKNGTIKTNKIKNEIIGMIYVITLYPKYLKYKPYQLVRDLIEDTNPEYINKFITNFNKNKENFKGVLDVLSKIVPT